MTADDTSSSTAKGLLERLDDAILAVNPDIWLVGALCAVVLPWLGAVA